MKQILTRLLRIPQTNETKTIEIADAWVVRWYSRTGSFSTEMREVAEFFLTEQEAQDFAVSLREAYRLLKHTGVGTAVTVSRSDE